MANMFSDKSDKRIPKTLNECTQRDATVTNLHIWAERLESWGQILFVILIIIGIISTIADAVAMADIDEDMVFITCITSAITWGLYAFIEYCAYHVLALLISALASITQNTIITANVALFKAAKNQGSTQEPTEKHIASQRVFSDNSTATNRPAFVPPTPENMWTCKSCGTNNLVSYGQCKKCGKYRAQ